MPAAYEATEEDRRLVKRLAEIGAPHRLIGKVLDITPVTLRKHFADELKKGKQTLNADVVKFLATAASGRALEEYPGEAKYKDCLTAAIFYAKTQLGWKETTKQEHSGPDGEALVTPVLNVAIGDKPKSASCSSEGTTE